ncbi:nucleoside hydrolase [Halocatena marina]|uniref:Nucleoside hydrolase n=1 Tax=Halocatena marina TaxID=2934937 RepID=A0ABD5YMT5_9EURY|nr:nucleoside hydrolase [Halocatena marina]
METNTTANVKADSDSARRLIVDTDTAGDDTIALLLAVCSDHAVLEGVTVVAGNVEFEHEVENAKYTLALADAEDVPVYEGARSPLIKDHETAEEVHGTGGLGGDLFPETGIPSADEHAVEYIVRTARENPGEITLACIGPLTNVAVALQHEPNLGELLDSVWVMGGARNCLGNVTPAAEFNFWVDPDAATRVLSEIDVTLVDWGVCLEHATLRTEEFEPIEAARSESPYADFFLETARPACEHTRETQGIDGTTQSDSLTIAGLLDPSIITETNTYPVAVDEREGMTRGYSLVDENGVTDLPANTRVVESVDGERFRELILDLLVHGDPHRSG